MFCLVDKLQPSLSIREVSQRSGCAASALRYYEQEGLLAALPRIPTASRRYSPQVLHTLEVINALREAGFGIGEIKAFLGAKRPDESLEMRLARTMQMLDDLQSTLNQRRAALEKAESLLSEWRKEIQAFAASQTQ
ncbi:hypothetical protein Dxin01_00586 [Deinococcus xinjiangensis]|uniref:HTH merR-type domain-containing protein n=1 Tax=Deinococcus xinjiangensis TaxID=457454 RepID=A0ABP9VC22_9DEIO